MRVLFVAVRFALAFATTGLAGSLAQAPAWAASDTKDPKQYGNCAVATEVDLLTDEETPVMICQGENSSTTVYIRRLHSGGFVAGLTVGLQFHTSDSISVAIRFYPDPVIERRARWSNGTAFLLDEQFVTRLLPKFATREKLVLKVGTKSDVIDLTGAARAVQDLRHRSGLLPQQTLEIPARAF